MIDLDLILGQASLPERTIRVCLDGKLLGRLAEARDEAVSELERFTSDLQYLTVDASDGVEEKQRAALTRLQAAREAAHAAERDVREAQTPFRLRALPAHALPALRVEHPPREGNEEDKESGVNLESYLLELTRRSLVDPADVTPDQWQRLLAVLQHGELSRLANAAYNLAHGQTNLGPTSLGSAPSLPSDDGSPSPES